MIDKMPGHHEFIRKLGDGAMAAVCRAHDPRLGRDGGNHVAC